jgi:DNA-binding NarL/FixJ family response regulator
MQSGKRRICIVEDNHDLREAMSMMIRFTDRYELLGSFPNAEQALDEIPALRPDAVLMDINLPGYSGIECVLGLKAALPDALFLMCTSHEDNERIFSSLQAGASGYILKTEGPARIIESLDELFNGGSPMSSSIARKVVASFNRTDIQGGMIQVLTDREREVLELLSKGLMNKEVAGAMKISMGTVRKHIQHIYEKLHVNTRVEAVNVFLNRG